MKFCQPWHRERDGGHHEHGGRGEVGARRQDAAVGPPAEAAHPGETTKILGCATGASIREEIARAIQEGSVAR